MPGLGPDCYVKGPSTPLLLTGRFVSGASPVPGTREDKAWAADERGGTNGRRRILPIIRLIFGCTESGAEKERRRREACASWPRGTPK